MPTVIVSGFEPWDRATENPTLAILDALKSQNSALRADLVTIAFPVDTTRIATMVENALDQHRPALWLGLGLAPGSSVIAVERLGANVLDYLIPDNASNQPHGLPIIADAPLAYPATIPINAIADAIRQRGIPVKISNSAGAYACNQLTYTVLHIIAVKHIETLAGFIHVPFTPDFVAQQPDAYREYPSMSLGLMVDAVNTAIAVSLQHVSPKPRRRRRS